MLAWTSSLPFEILICNQELNLNFLSLKCKLGHQRRRSFTQNYGLPSTIKAALNAREKRKNEKVDWLQKGNTWLYKSQSNKTLMGQGKARDPKEAQAMHPKNRSTPKTKNIKK
jgi:hypothetical protein